MRKRWTTSVVAFLVSVLGSSLASTALATVLGIQVFELTHSEFDLGLLGLAQFAPAALLVFVTGTLADRFDRRLLSAVGLVGQAAVAAVLAWYIGTGPTSATPIFLLMLAYGTTQALQNPATRALPPDIVTGPALPWLMVRRSAAWQLASIAGPVVGAFLYVVDVRLPFVAMAVLLVASAAAVLTVKVMHQPVVVVDEIAPSLAAVEAAALDDAAVEATAGGQVVEKPVRATLHDAFEGFRFIRTEPVLLGAISLDLFAVLFGGAVALLPAIAEDRLGVGAVGLGWLRAATGIGAAVVTLILAWKPVAHRVGTTLLVAVAIFGVGTIVLGATRSYAVAFVALLILSGADAISVFIRSTLVPLVTPNETRGRVLAVENVFIGASNELGAFESGSVGQLLGAGPSVVLGGAATLVVALAWWKIFPALRRVDKFPGT
ncbi:MAG: transporter [Actinomycetia bacterium]|nr:transporter [Actinomycetes bacterium]